MARVEVCRVKGYVALKEGVEEVFKDVGQQQDINLEVEVM